MKKQTKALLVAASLFVTSSSQAQNTIGFSGTVAAGSAPAGSGLSNTNKTVTFHQGQAVAAPPGAVYTPTTTVTFSLSNQQFTSIEGNAAIPGINFGGTITNAANTPPGFTYWNGLNAFGGTYVSNFTACNTCPPGINSTSTTASNAVRENTLGALELILYTDALINSSGNAVNASVAGFPGHPTLTGRFYYGDLTLTFNRPVSNPVIHFADIGGRVNYNTLIGGATVNYILGFTTDFKLTTPGLSLSKLSGSSSLKVASGDSIYNNATLFGAPSSGETYAGEARTAASGSVVVLGNNITAITFRLTLRGDGGSIRNSTGVAGSATAATLGNIVRWAVHGAFPPCNGAPGCTPVGGINLVSGDGMLIAVGLQRPVTVSGNLFHDINAGNVNSSSAVAIPAGVYANLVDANGNVVASQLIPNTGGTAGTFSFTGVGEGDYTVSISTTPGVQGLTKPVESLPAGWGNTGEFNGTPNTGNDGNPNGISEVFTVGTTDVADRNFGIQRVPESAVNLQPDQSNPGGFNGRTVPAGAFQTSNVGVNPNTQDYDGGTVNNIRITAFPANTNSITINGVVYTNGGTCPPATACTPWPGAGVTIPYNNGVGPTQAIAVDPVDGNVDVIIPFVSIDNAGSEDPTPGSVTLPFKSISLSGTVFNDLNANVATVGTPEGGENVINGTNAGGGITTGAVLYANLVDGSNNVIASVPVLADGTYSFPSVPINAANLSVQLSTNQGAIGLAKPATNLPAGWMNTGENKNGQGGAADALANGEIPVTTTTVNITAQNFGIQQLPESAVNLQPDHVNPGGVVTVTVPPTAFQVSNVGVNPNTQDYNGGTVDNIRITAFPSNISNITINGISYTSGTWPPGGVTIPYSNGVGPNQPIVFDPIDGLVTVVIPFVSIDNAGVEDPTPGSVTIPFTAILPISFVNINATVVGTKVLVSWEIGVQTDAGKYYIERSTDGLNFISIGNTPFANNVFSYSFSDPSPVNGTNYYRIRAVENGGAIKYSAVARASFSGKVPLDVRPNPSSDLITVKGLSGEGTLSIIAADGKVVERIAVKGTALNWHIGHLQNGVYILQYNNAGGVRTMQLVKK